MQRNVNGINCLLCTAWARLKQLTRLSAKLGATLDCSNPLPNYCENFQKPHNRQQKQYTRTHAHTQTHTRVQIHSNTQLADTFHENVRIRFGRCRRCRCRCRLVSITRLTADINCPMSPNGNCVNCLTIFQQIY